MKLAAVSRKAYHCLKERKNMARLLRIVVLGFSCASLIFPGVLQAQRHGGGGVAGRGSVGASVSRPAAGPAFVGRPSPVGQPNPIVSPGRSFVGSPGIRSPHAPFARSPRA